MFGWFKGKKSTDIVRDTSKLDKIYSSDYKNWPYEIKLVQADNHFRIMSESVDLISQTVYAATFFKRYNIALEEADIIFAFDLGAKYDKQVLGMVNILKNEKTDIINDFLTRCYKSGKLPYEKNEILSHRNEMTPESIKYFYKLIGWDETSNDTKEYVFCSVSFDDSDRTYFYISETKDVCPGDSVIVPVGKNAEPKEATVMDVKVYNGNNAPIPVSATKKIIEIL